MPVSGFGGEHPSLTCVSAGGKEDGAFGFAVSEGETVDGPHLKIGNTTSRVDFGRDPGEWTDAWSATGISHHWALGTGHRAEELRALADLMEVEVITV
jgi:L-arabinose isomerase